MLIESRQEIQQAEEYKKDDTGRQGGLKQWKAARCNTEYDPEYRETPESGRKQICSSRWMSTVGSGLQDATGAQKSTDELGD